MKIIELKWNRIAHYELYVRLSLRPLGQQAYHVWLKELLKYLCSNSSSRLFTFLYPISYQSAQFFRRALHYASGGRKIPSQECLTPMGERIYYHPQTDFCSTQNWALFAFSSPDGVFFFWPTNCVSFYFF